MRYLVILLSVLLSLILTTPLHAADEPNAPTAGELMSNPQSPANAIGGDPSPWPWGQEAAFPWAMIRGTWANNDPECADMAFVFRARYAKPNRRRRVQKVVEIREYDSKQCSVVATGVGYELDRVVRATMVKTSGESYELTIRAFSKTSSPYSTPISALATSVVMTIEPHGSFQKEKTLELKKIGDEPKMICYDVPKQ